MAVSKKMISIANYKNLLKNHMPIVEWLPKYTWRLFLYDLLAGFTVALTEIPQSIAYAGVAGLPLQYGLYSSFMGGFIYTVLGTCKVINMGSTSVMSILIQPYVKRKGPLASIFMSFVSGAIILVFGLMRLGVIIECFSYPVMTGFTSAAALTTASSQLINFFGLSGQTDGFLDAWKFFANNVQNSNKWDTILGCTSLVTVFFLKEIGTYFSNKQNYKHLKKITFFLSISKNAIVVLIGILVAYLLSPSARKHIKLTGPIQGGFPQFEVSQFDDFVDMAKTYGISLIFIPIVAILETVAIGKVFSGDKPLNASQEMVALGVSNLAGSFVNSMPVTGSFTRTTVNAASGAKTNMSSVFTGVTILLALKFLTGAFQYIPKATLSAVIICAMYYLFDFKAMLLFWTLKKLDFFVYVVTLLSCLFISLEYGILIGILINLAIVLYSSARPALELVKVQNYNAYFIELPAAFHFVAIEHLRNKILSCEEVGSLIILNGKFLKGFDLTIAKNLNSLVKDAEKRDQKLLFLNFEKSIEHMCIEADCQLLNYFQQGNINDVLTAQDLTV